jgi:hypothetical protein
VGARDPALQLLRGADRHDGSVVQHRDAVGELVRLVEVLRGEEDRDALRDELADDRPHRAPAARVEAGGGLVEEDDSRRADQRHGEVEPAPHAAGVDGRELVRGVHQVEALQQLRDAAPAGVLAEVLQVRHQREVLGAGEQVVDRRELAGDAEEAAHRSRVGDDVVPGDVDLAGIGAEQRGQDLDRRRLAGAVRPEQREDGA